MSKKHKKSPLLDPKVPRASNTPTASKTPRVGTFPSDQDPPEFRVEQMDLEGPWGWDKFESHCLQDLMHRIFEIQKLNWQDIARNGSHSVPVADLNPRAQKRLMQIEKDDLDELYSLRISGKKRVWGIREGRIFWILWWDPEHEVCPSPKKHT